jgi:hypothetical protein
MKNIDFFFRHDKPIHTQFLISLKTWTGPGREKI